jgi:hypothetical protein
MGAHPDSRAERLEKARRELGHMAWLLDSSFRIPGTRFRFGLEPIIGLVPGAGDLVSGALGFYLVLRAMQFRLPIVVILRMVANTVLDLIIGAVPLLGDLFDFVYKSNRRNMELFERYATDPDADTRSQWAFLAGVVMVAVGSLLLVAWLIDQALQQIARDLG